MPSYGQGRDHPGPRRTSLIHGEHLRDVVVTSHPDAWGTIDGHGQPWWDAHNQKTEKVTRGHLIEFMYSEKIEISNLKLRNSPFWTVHPVYSRDVVVRNVTCNNCVDGMRFKTPHTRSRGTSRATSRSSTSAWWASRARPSL